MLAKNNGNIATKNKFGLPPPDKPLLSALPKVNIETMKGRQMPPIANQAILNDVLYCFIINAQAIRLKKPEINEASIKITVILLILSTDFV
jgi:hypothetical protein